MDKENKTVTESKTSDKECFVIMPFSDGDGYEKGHFRRVYEDIIVPAINNSGFVPKRADDVQETNLIHLDILKRLIDAPICVCDLSSRNPNVLFELGIRQAFDKPVVLIQEMGTPKIFDITMLRLLEYQKEMGYREVLEIQDSLTEAIKATSDAKSDSANVNSIIKLLSISAPASIPKLGKDNKDGLTFDIISSQINDLRRMIESFAIDSKRSMIRRSVASYEYERLSNKIDELYERQKSGDNSPSFLSSVDALEEELMMARRLPASSLEMESSMFLMSRLRRLKSRIVTK